MPNLIGQPLGSATLALQDAGIKLGEVVAVPAQLPAASGAQDSPTEISPASEPGAASMIVGQTPQPGQKLAAGSAVNLEVL